MKSPMPRVFISHSSLDREFVERELIPLVRDHGIDTWYSRDDIAQRARMGEKDPARTALVRLVPYRDVAAIGSVAVGTGGITLGG